MKWGQKRKRAAVTSGLFWAKTPMNWLGLGRQPWCKRPEPRCSARAITWKVKKKNIYNQLWRIKIHLKNFHSIFKEDFPFCRNSQRNPLLQAWPIRQLWPPLGKTSRQWVRVAATQFPLFSGSIAFYFPSIRNGSITALLPSCENQQAWICPSVFGICQGKSAVSSQTHPFL